MIDLVGRRFGRLVVTSRAPDAKYLENKRRYMWNCLCDCGAHKVCRGTHLTSGAIQSCGCYGRERLKASITTHGGTHTRLYGVWVNMKNRCYNKNVRSYKDYGARGITVCDEWSSDFAAFRDWAYSTGYCDTADYQQCTIDRINGDGNYEPDNCHWATAKEQANNRRPPQRTRANKDV